MRENGTLSRCPTELVGIVLLRKANRAWMRTFKDRFLDAIVENWADEGERALGSWDRSECVLCFGYPQGR